MRLFGGRTRARGHGHGSRSRAFRRWLLPSLVLCIVVATLPGSERSRPTETLWCDEIPNAVTVDDGLPVELGTRFSSTSPGRVLGVRYYSDEATPQAHPGNLWSQDGRLLATATFPKGESAGWRTAYFSSPVAITAGEAYVASYLAPRGRYVSTRSSQARARPGTSLRVDEGGAGRFAYGDTSKFPNQQWQRSNYWVDVVFEPSPLFSGVDVAPDETQSSSAPDSPRASESRQPQSGSLGCHADPGRCGYPDAATTGPQSDRELIKVPEHLTSGPGWSWSQQQGIVRVTGAGAVLEGLDISGGVVIDGPDVTLSNSVVSACGNLEDGADVVAVRYRPQDGYHASNARILHNRLLGTPSDCPHRARSGVADVFGAASGLIIRSNDISGAGNGIRIEYEAEVTDNWVHDLGQRPGDHNSGISTHGGAARIIVRHNTVLLDGTPSLEGGGVSAALTVYSDFATAQNITLEDNFVSGGAYTVSGGRSGGRYSPSSPPHNIRIVGNRFVCKAWVYGPVASFDAAQQGNLWLGNYCDGDGRALAADAVPGNSPVRPDASAESP